MLGHAAEIPEGIAPRQNRRARWIIACLVLLFVLNVLLLPLINLGSYHRTIAESLSRSLGHTVHLGSANLTIFPLPGLVIHDLVVEEDPAFGAEPLLRSPSVTVHLRLSSLWRRRLEISSIDLDNASVNLARNASGQWNFSSLLLQASRTATAPTAQRRPSAAPRFPYIEFSGARINFKQGGEKKALSFLNADAAVWLADPNQWRIRFEAQPARTDLDLDLEDTGTIRLTGSVTRAAALDQLPLDLHAEWTGAQMGQVSRLMLGSDSGWRGDLRADADITGDLRDLTLHTRLRIANAHRLEFTPVNQLNIETLCRAEYHRPLRLLDNLTCLLPTGDGHLLLTGAVQNLGRPEPRFNLEINHTPVPFAVSLLGLLRSSLPATLDATGTINGQFAWGPQVIARKTIAGKTAAPQNVLTGHAVADDVVIRLANVDQPVTFAVLRFATPSETATPTAAGKWVPGISHLKRGSATSQLSWREARVPGRPVLLETAAFAAGTPTPMQISGQFTRSGFSLHFTGESSIARLQPLARSLAQVHALADLAPKGTAQADLTFSGPWIPPINSETGADAQVLLQGSIRLQRAEIKPAWLPEPIEVADATAQFGGAVTWDNATVSVNGITAKGSASWPRICGNPDGCPAQVTLDFPVLDSATLQSALLGAGRHGEFLQAILSTVESPAPPWPALNATIHAGTLTIGNLKLTNVRTALAASKNRLNILSLDASALGGSTHATGSIEPASGGPNYALNFAWTGVKLTEAASLFHEKWGTGSIDGQMNLTLHGYSSLASTAAGDFHWTITGNWAGTPSEAIPEKQPENGEGLTFLNTSQNFSQNLFATRKSNRAPRWIAAGTISNQTLALTKGPAEGAITFGRKLDLAWPETASQPAAEAQTSNSTIQLTGTLAHPIIGISVSPQPLGKPNPRDK